MRGFFEEQTKGNLEKLVLDLIQEGEEMYVTDANLPVHLVITPTFV
jgi:antitoxin (DNA-binding transcriptional repressor) of toxin-antitoxin stability system